MTRAIVLAAALLAPVWPVDRASPPRLSRHSQAGVQPSSAQGATLSGTVRTEDGTPIDRAIVMVLGSDGPVRRTAVTGAAGEFLVEDLPPGSFAIWATKPGFVSSFLGSRHPGRGPAIPVALASGQRATVHLTMLSGASIGGRISDSTGRPLAQVSVRVRAVSMPRASASVVPASMTDGRGVFRVSGLAPGEYIVEALPPPMPNSQAVLVTADEVKWALQQAQRGRSFGTTGSPSGGSVVGYAPTYFPGVAIRDQAGTVSVGPGEHREDLAFSLQLVGAAAIAGRVVAPIGQPMSSVQLVLVDSEPAGSPHNGNDRGAGAVRVPVADSGEFAVAGVVPGTYALWARWDANISGTSGSDTPTLWGYTTVAVNGLDRSGLVLSLRPGARVSGTVRLDSAASKPAMDSVRIALSTQLSNVAPFIRTLVATPDMTGRFLFPSVPPGPYDLRTAAAAPVDQGRWVLESALFSGHDVTDGTLDVRLDEDVGGVVVTLTDQETEISGTLLDAARRPTAQFSVLFFSVDRSRWTHRSRRVQAVQPGVDGTFRLSGLPPGEYFVVADPMVDPGTPADAAYLEQLATIAGRLTLARGEKRRVDLALTSSRGPFGG